MGQDFWCVCAGDKEGDNEIDRERDKERARERERDRETERQIERADKVYIAACLQLSQRPPHTPTYYPLSSNPFLQCDCGRDGSPACCALEPRPPPVVLPPFDWETELAEAGDEAVLVDVLAKLASYIEHTQDGSTSAEAIGFVCAKKDFLVAAKTKRGSSGVVWTPRVARQLGVVLKKF